MFSLESPHICSYGTFSKGLKHAFETQHIVTTSSTEPYSLMKLFLTIFKIDPDTKSQLKPSREGNSGSIKARVVIPIPGTSS